MKKNIFKIEFKLLKNNDKDKTHEAEIIISNFSDCDYDNWTLCFNQYMYSLELIDGSNDYGEIVNEIGDYFEIKGKATIPNRSNLILKVRGGSLITNLTDTPSCYYIVIDCKEVYSVVGFSDISIINSRSSKQETITCLSDSEKNKLRLIPIPSYVVYGSNTCDFNKFFYIRDFTKLPETKITISTFIENFKEIIPTEINFCSIKESIKYEIVLENNNMDSDKFIIDIKPEVILIKAGSQGGFLYALISLFKLADAYNNKIPCLTITDEPRFLYRGMLLDVARNFRTVEEVKKFMKMMAMYKLNIFHCLLSDDEGWRIEIKKYPNITESGGYRGFGEVIPSHHGSGNDKTGGFYTQEEIRMLIDYANSLNITFIPEIVIPGHSRALITSFNDYYEKGNNPLVDKDDKSKYKSAQNFKDNTLNPGLKETFNILSDIYGEIADIFKIQQTRNMPFSNYFHIGVDETPEGAWMHSPVCEKLIKEYGLDTTRKIQFYFVNKVIEILKENGYKTAGWQEIVYGGAQENNDMLVYLWNSKLDGFDLNHTNIPLILAPSPYFYFDLAYSEDPYEPGLHWAGCNNPEIIYSFDPLSGDIFNEEQIKGVQACLWSENLGLPKLTNNDKLPKRFLECAWEYMAFPKMTAFSEVAWGKQNNRSWKSYNYRYQYEKKILDKMNIKYRD